MTEPAVEHQEKRNDALYEATDRMVSLATATLALSVTFRTNLAGPQPVALGLLKLAWAALATTAICGVLLRLNKVWVHGLTAERLRSGQRRSYVPAGCLFQIVLGSCLLGFVAGLSAFAAFGFLNLR